MELFFVTLVLGLISYAFATGPIPVSRSGLAGIDGFTFYDPYCGHGCFRSFSAFQLGCSNKISPGGHTTAGDAAHQLAICRASNFPYLSSIAWCIYTYCSEEVRNSKIEHFWETQITGDVNVLPHWSYGEVMANISEPPSMVMVADGMAMDMVLNMTALTTFETWQSTWITLYYFFRETALESYYGLAILLTLFSLPLALTWLGYLPFMTRGLHLIRPYLWPSLIGTYHHRPLPYSIGNVPTIGQSIYIAVVIILNIVFLGVGYKTAYPKYVFNWYTDRYQELMAYFMWRTGVLAFCQMPVVFLFSSRNNLLLWLTNWSHSTYMLLHRWIARMFLLQTLLHSIIALILYKNTGSYDASVKLLWWRYGVVGTLAAVIIVVTSFLAIRRSHYELFLVTHIVMSVLCVVGCWYHVWYGYENCFGYETWLYATIAVWFFDRLARLARVFKTGLRRAELTQIGSTIVRVDIPDISWAAAGHCVYVYFPTVNPLRPWENHPFSMIPTAMLRNHSTLYRPNIGNVEKNHDMKSDTEALAINHHLISSGLTLFVRKTQGMTKSLKAEKRLLTMLEGPYPTNPTKAVMQSDRLLLVGGGIGITGLLPFLWCHPNVKLFHSVKADDECLIEHLHPSLKEVREKDILVGQRLSIDVLLREEASAGWPKIGVVVCGPAGMCDDTRAAVSRLAKDKVGDCSFALEVDAFSW